MSTKNATHSGSRIFKMAVMLEKFSKIVSYTLRLSIKYIFSIEAQKVLLIETGFRLTK